MKKIVLIILATAFLVNYINAQDSSTDNRDELQFGLKAGGNLSNVYDTEGGDFIADPKIGFAGGAFLSLPIGKYIGLQPEILYSQKGFKGKILGIEYTHTTSYIDIPVLLALKPSGVFTILAGPQVSFLVKQKDVIGNASLTQEFDDRKSTICFLGGIDVSLSQLIIGARAGWDIQDNDGDGTASNPRYKNVWYQVTLGIRF